ncbi:protein phosphatase CheZ [Marinobacterium jannaschii]|uniref:protein phosphatase CheZ n=1 Tax=Marinobacterium jannaschii TaxID=64970 RepID=UPI00047F76E1|nr:protein phosphatase CheZ [Marinobacterium jannaschii]
MSAADINKSGVERFEGQLQEKARELVSVLDQGDLSSAMDLIRDLHEYRHQAFYQEIGHLTRGLHEAIKSFSDDLGNNFGDAGETTAVFTDASDRLNHVIELTEKNAHDTMDRIDSALTLVDRLDTQSERFKDLLSLVGQLEGEYVGLQGTYDRTCQLKEESEVTIETLRSQLTDILVSQSYQDITGQLIRRVIHLVTNVEQHLVLLMDMASKVERIAGLEKSKTEVAQVKETRTQADVIQAEGPQINTSGKADVAQNQDDVDELLSSLGF